MCGIVGYWSAGTPPDADLAERMAAAIWSRGPDGGGVWLDDGAGLALAHRRLSIVDLSASGAQPMRSADGRSVIVFNGEIYNHNALRVELEREGRAPPWRGHSDTETLLAACTAWGVEAALRSSVGMFALALWDTENRTLTLARDRLGEKPLYVGWQGGTLLFGSQLKAFRIHPRWRGELSEAALRLFLQHNYVPGPYSAYRGIYKLPPGTSLTLALNESPHYVHQECLALLEKLPTWDGRGAIRSRTVRFGAYWSLPDVVVAGANDPFSGTDEEGIDQLEAVLKTAVGLQMVADVPLGAFLSGGVDSSTVVALMQAQSSSPVRTFSIGFREQEYNEAQYAKAVASHLGTQHTELYVSPEDALSVIPQLPGMYDEPFSDSSQIPTHLVARLARSHVTVSLSGDGGDELFCGYPRYSLASRVWRQLARVPVPIRRVLSMGLQTVPASSGNELGNLLPGRLHHPHLGERVHRLATAAAATSANVLYQDLLTHWRTPPILNQAIAVNTIERTAAAAPPEFVSRMMYFDTLGYLPDDILVKVDRAAMAVSLETRVPLLDHRVVEFAWRLPMRLKVRENQTKWLLRQVLYRHVPRDLIDRPKMGFGVPIDRWLRGPLRDWAEELLSVDSIRASGVFDEGPVRKKWKEHLQGRQGWQYLLWDVLMWQAWHQTLK
jgi:asparagine synthase (glutamine-hydrolysing)